MRLATYALKALCLPPLIVVGLAFGITLGLALGVAFAIGAVREL